MSVKLSKRVHVPLQCFVLVHCLSRLWNQAVELAGRATRGGHPETAGFQSPIVRFCLRKETSAAGAAGAVVMQRYATARIGCGVRPRPPSTSTTHDRTPSSSLEPSASSAFPSVIGRMRRYRRTAGADSLRKRSDHGSLLCCWCRSSIGTIGTLTSRAMHGPRPTAHLQLLRHVTPLMLFAYAATPRCPAGMR